MNECLYVCQCGESYIFQKDNKLARCPACLNHLQQLTMPAEDDLLALSHKTLLEIMRVCFLQPCDSNNTLLEPFLMWEIGTPRQTIIDWLDDRIGRLIKLSC